jgi:DNA polymerase III delta subunit
VCDLLKDNTDDTNAQVKHRTAIMVVVMFACLVTLSVMLVTVTVVTGQEKLLIAGEVLAVCVAFFLFDWFFFKVVVAGTEPATAASLIDLAMQKFLSEVTLTKLRTADHCKSPPS